MKIPSVAQIGNVLAANSGGLLGYWSILDHDTQIEICSFDVFNSFNYNKQSQVAQYPIELGSFFTYNKQNQPFNVGITLIKSGFSIKYQKEAFQNKLEEYCDGVKLVDVVTPSKTFLNCTLSGLQYGNTPDEGADMIVANLTVSEVRYVGGLDTENVKTPNISTRVKQGLKSLVGL